LVASTQGADRGLGARGLDREPIDPTHRLADLGAAAQPAPDEMPPEVADGQVLPDVHRTEGAAQGALGGHEGDTGIDRLSRREVVDRGPGEHDITIVARHLSGDQAEHVLATGTRDAGQPHDLTRDDIEVDAVDRSASQTSHGQQRAALASRLRRARGVDAVPDDQLHETRVVELGHGHRADPLAVAKDSHAIGEFEHLVEVVGDVEDRDATPSQPVNYLEETLDLGAGKCGGRLVEDQQRGALLPTDEGPGDRDRGALRGLQRVDRCLDVDAAEAERIERLACPLDLVAPADTATGGGEVPGGQRQVLDGVETADESEVLMHEPDARLTSCLAVAERQRPAVDPGGTLARIGLVVAGEDFDQRRLAGTVLADESVDLTGSDVDRHVVERDLARKGLRQVLDPQRFSQGGPPIPD
jgi:hypothetical protein